MARSKSRDNSAQVALKSLTRTLSSLPVSDSSRSTPRQEALVAEQRIDRRDVSGQDRPPAIAAAARAKPEAQAFRRVVAFDETVERGGDFLSATLENRIYDAKPDAGFALCAIAIGSVFHGDGCVLFHACVSPSAGCARRGAWMR
jgi:hypothetical protein